MKIEKSIDLDLTQYSGQTSQAPWKNIDKTFEELLFINNQAILIKLTQKNNTLIYNYELPLDCDYTVKNKDIEREIANIFDLNFDLDKFYTFLKDDEKLSPSIDFCKNLRLFLAKDKFECIISSISSSNNSIARWTSSIDKIKSLWGEEYKFPSGTFYSFPKVKSLENRYVDDDEDLENCGNTLKSCGVGYRSSYIKNASKFFLEYDLNEISKMDYEEAFKFIQEVPGVGPKVADCILLYGFNFREAFPTDVWIKRIISHLYFDNEDISVKKIREFGLENFKENAGYIQLYLFHYARKSGMLKKLKR
ncbi:DNA glycosylase [Methanobrevibacter sp. DSM 116169]|uniref:DNA glycosylase n=1 Tax=Methanobrevibacter sp. DSM 116169 TaxID=3242727 RepID=UPI0038FCA5B4